MSESPANPDASTHVDGARRLAWTPPPRPEWVARIIEEGKHLDLHAVVPLDENSLLDCARRNTGLSDFGADEWREPFQRLAKSMDEEAQLHLMGRLMARSDLLIFLEARLRIEDTYKNHPEIDDERQGRTGTSVLQNMLSADPHNGPLMTWESMFPCPPPEAATYRTDPRIAKADRLATQWNRVTPEAVAIHEFAGDVPVESIHLQSLSFRTPGWLNLVGQVPSFTRWVTQQDVTIAYAYEKRALKLLQWKNPHRHWVLKTPIYILHMPEILKVFPDACFIWTHRDPVKALSSVINTLGTCNWIRSDTPFIGGSFDQHTGSVMAAQMMTQPIDWLESGSLPREQLCNIQYLDFVRDPMRCVETIYARFGIPLTPEGRTAMQRYMDERPRSTRPEHAYDTGSPEQVAAERQLFKRYSEYFNVPDEV
jgi:Sulfotransferase family